MSDLPNLEGYAQEIFGYYQAINGVAKPSEFDYKFKEVITSFLKMYARFCPFAKGDRVALSKTPEILEGSGWFYAKHFLVKGALATVRSTDFRDGLFHFSLVFDNDSCIHYRTGEIIPADPKYIFRFSEKWIEKATTGERE
jgi:hypothetical protein